jgi:hypothetical protein
MAAAALGRWRFTISLSRQAAPMRPIGVWSCVTLGVVLGVALVQWPYARSCGWSLSLYLSSVGMLLIAGIWGAWHAWDSRIGVAHIVAIATILWGCSLAAQEVLPRVGYAKQSAAWSCSVPQRTFG